MRRSRGQPGYSAPVNASYNPATGAPRDAGAPPSGVYAPNAAVVPGTQEAPSGPGSKMSIRASRGCAFPPPDGGLCDDAAGRHDRDRYRKHVSLLRAGRREGGSYGIGVGRDGFTWAGTEKITRKAEWADWRPPTEMIDRQPYLPRFMAGGPGNPLGARDPVSRRHHLPHPRHQRAADHRQVRVVRLLPDAECGRGRPV